MRNLISQKLQCDPMRISKKFVGEKRLGKRTYMAKANRELRHGNLLVQRTKAAASELERLHSVFREKVRVDESARPGEQEHGGARLASGKRKRKWGKGG